MMINKLIQFQADRYVYKSKDILNKNVNLDTYQYCEYRDVSIQNRGISR